MEAGDTKSLKWKCQDLGSNSLLKSLTTKAQPFLELLVPVKEIGLAFTMSVTQPTLMDVPRYFWCNILLLYRFVYHIFMTSALVGCWSSVSIRWIIYKFLNVCPFDYTTVVVSGEGWDPVNLFNHTSMVTIITPTNHPKSVRNRCVIEVFGGVCVLSRCYLGFSVGVGAFVIGLSLISSFFSLQ